MSKSIKRLTTLNLIAVFFSLMNHNAAYSQGHSIDITVDGLENEQVILGYHQGKQRLIYDTLQASETGLLTFSGYEPLPRGVYFLYAKTFYFEFLIHEQTFSLSLNRESAYSSLKVDGSRENELFASFQAQMGEMQKQQRQIADSISLVTGEDSISLINQYTQIVDNMNAVRSSMVASNQGTFFSEFLSLMVGVSVPEMDTIEYQGDRQLAKYEYYRHHYMDILPEPARLMRTPVIHEYVMKYFKDLVIPHPDSVNIAVDKFLARIPTHDESFRYWLVTLFNHYQESKIMGMDAVTVHMAEKYYLSGMADWITDEAKEEIRKEIRFIKPNLIGNPGPDMILVDTTLKPFYVSKLPSEYLVLFFYDPDCGVCRKKTPLLKEIYPELKSEGAEVVAICTITDTEKWKSYIAKNQLNWLNAGDPQGRSNFRVDYNVRSTPQFFILDKERKIVAKKLDVSQLLGFIRDHKSMQEK
jgi:peroxiredoxin